MAALSLGPLIGRLDGLLEVLESPDSSWKQRFRQQWGALEDVYAIALSQKEEGRVRDASEVIGQAGNQAVIKMAIENMKSLLQEQGHSIHLQ
jgi:hypothetical protein